MKEILFDEKTFRFKYKKAKMQVDKSISTLKLLNPEKTFCNKLLNQFI